MTSTPTGMTVTRGQQTQAYLDRVGAALADLPEEERADLLDEVGTHLDEIAAEGTSPLEARLGSPEDYAAELRASAGLPPAQARGRAVARWRSRVEGWLARPGTVGVREFLWSLRPFWWVVRGWVLVAAVVVFSRMAWSRDLIVVPAGPLGLLTTVGVVVLSVQLGRGLLGAGRRLPRLVLAVNLVAAVLALPTFVSLADTVRSLNDSVLYASEPQTVEVYPSEGVYANGTQVWNVYAYDAAGAMLSNVRLYDQDGTPLSLGLSFDPTKAQTLDAQGRKVDNAFPYRYLDPTTGEVTDPAAGPAIVAPPLLGVPTTTATPTSSPSPTASPTTPTRPSPSPSGKPR